MINLMNNFKKFGYFLKEHWKISVAILVSITVVLLYLINKSLNSSSTTYQTSVVEKGTLISSVSVSGKVVTSNILEITTQATGTVKKVYVKDGQKVYKGQKVAEVSLDASGLLAYSKAKASLDTANNNYRLTQASLAKTYDEISGHDSDETLTMKETRTKAEVSNDNAWTNLQQAQLSYNLVSPIITSPYTGVINNLNIVEGVNISSEKRVATVSTNGNPVVELSLSEVDINKVKVGQKATITFDSLPNKTFTGVLATVDRLGTTNSSVTTYNAYLKLDNKSDDLLPNMSGTANIILESLTDVVIVPNAAVETKNNTSYVKLLKNNNQELIEVTLGMNTDNGIEVKSGLSAGDVVIVGTSSSTTKTTTTKSVFSSVGGGMGIPR